MTTPTAELPDTLTANVPQGNPFACAAIVCEAPAGAAADPAPAADSDRRQHHRLHAVVRGRTVTVDEIGGSAPLAACLLL